MEQPLSQELFSLHIDPATKSYLGETARWGKFLAIIGFIICGLVVLGALFLGSVFNLVNRSANEEFGGSFRAMAGAGTMVIAVIYILIALLYFFPCLYLYRFSDKMKAALASNSQQHLNTSFQNLKSLFKFVGILTLIILAFYALALMFVLVMGVSFPR